MATWEIAELERNTSDGGVITAHWRVKAEEVVDGEITNSASRYGSVSFTPDSSAGDFIAYADLTEANVIQWVKDSMGADEVSTLEAAVDTELEAVKNPTVSWGKPW